MKTIEERFWSFVRKHECGCWEWGRSCNEHGYGVFYMLNRQFLAHRVCYELCIGEIPQGLKVLHRCDNPKCVRPDHLFIGTQLENIEDMVRKGRRKGTKHALAKLNDEQVLAVRASVKQGRILARELGVSEALISLIRSRKIWSHI